MQQTRSRICQGGGNVVYKGNLVMRDDERGKSRIRNKGNEMSNVRVLQVVKMCACAGRGLWFPGRDGARTT